MVMWMEKSRKQEMGDGQEVGPMEISGRALTRIDSMGKNDGLWS
jgi:hypothetical protein